MKKQNINKGSVAQRWTALALAVAAVTTASVGKASVPSRFTASESAALPQGFSEIRAAKEADLTFDQDVKRLAGLERQYRERLPLTADARVRTPAKRLSPRSAQR